MVTGPVIRPFPLSKHHPHPMSDGEQVVVNKNKAHRKEKRQWCLCSPSTTTQTFQQHGTPTTLISERSYFSIACPVSNGERPISVSSTLSTILIHMKMTLHSGKLIHSSLTTTKLALSLRNHPLRLYSPSTVKSIYERYGVR